jgi:hypothetical protein
MDLSDTQQLVSAADIPSAPLGLDSADMSIKKPSSRSSVATTEEVEKTDQPPTSTAYGSSLPQQGQKMSVDGLEKAEEENPGFTLVVPPKVSHMKYVGNGDADCPVDFYYARP